MTPPSDTIIPAPRLPRATYRVQFNAQFTFRDALALVPYLDALGVSDFYASPILRANPGSMHGYDVCDPTQLNPELGTPEEFAALSDALRERGMGLLLDTVPNHMGISSACNAWWMDVLENGPSSPYATYFDIDWQPVKAEIANKVLLPILGDQYGQALESGALQLAFDNGAFWLAVYGDALRLPIAPQTYDAVLVHRLDALREELGADAPDVQELESIITALHHLPAPIETEPERVAERYREKEVVKRRIAALYATSEAARGAIDATIQAFNGNQDDPASFDALDDLIARQSYRPAYWRVASEEINYRRFFDINALGAIQVERPEVFEATHALIFHLLAAGQVTGLRIDHPDGLWDPAQYFRQVQDRFVSNHVQTWLQAHTGEDGAIDPAAQEQAEAELTEFRAALAARQDEARDWPLYVVVEKILSEREPLPLDWPVAGTSGYDFLNSVNNLLVARENERDFTRIYQDFTGDATPYAAQVTEAKRLIMDTALNSEINALGHQLERITERNRRYRDYTLNSLIDALHEVIIHLQIYRTYTTGDLKVTERDQQYIGAAIAEAKRRNQRVATGIFDFLEDTLLLRNLVQFREADRQAVVDFVMKFQQVTGPVMAKSLEDTAFYRYNRLVGLNEVGGNPEQFGISVTTFHDQNLARVRDWPHALLATATHDTKRGEDVRARLAALAEFPNEWEVALMRWRDLNAPAKTGSGADAMPSANDEYLLYQTLLGIWPEGDLTPEGWDTLRQRVTEYMTKAVQEAKVASSWVNPNQAYLDTLRDFIARLLDPRPDNAFIADFLPFQRRIAYFGRWNALAQTALKLAAPGVPDFYQGTELWDLALVDPDNRRPVDYAQRQHFLDEARRQRAEWTDHPALCQSYVDSAADGRIKLYVASRGLQLRREYPDVFAQGTYRALEARGAAWQHVCAFARQRPDMTIIAIAPRLPAKLVNGDLRPPIGEVWGDTWLTLPDDFSGQRYRDSFTDTVIPVGERDGVPCLDVAAALAHFPVALLRLERE